MQCPQCHTQLDDDTVFCGNCGKQLAPFQAQGATVTYKTEAADDELPTIISGQSSQRSASQMPARNYISQPDTPYIPSSTPPPARKSNTRRIVFIVVLILLIIGIVAAGTIAVLKNYTTAKNNNPGTSSLA